MKGFNKEAQEWLRLHKHELMPEELVDENFLLSFEKKKNSGTWPTPLKLPNMGVFEYISNEESFNRIIGCKKNWEVILNRMDVYRQWIVPHAVLIFGKKWFNNVKWKKSIQKSKEISLFSEFEKKQAKKTGIPLEDTNSGKSKIIMIYSRVEHSLEVYLKGGGLTKNNLIKKPGNYIISSIKNEFIKEIRSEAGYKLTQIPICPLCASQKINGRKNKTFLLEVEPGIYKCEKCSNSGVEVYDKKGVIRNKEYTKKQKNNSKLFSRFKGLMFICPSNECSGNFVPIRSVKDDSWWDTNDGKRANDIIKSMRSFKGTQRFKLPKNEMLEIPLTCPYCGTNFTPKKALKMKSGYKNKSGMITGVPISYVWKKNESIMLDSTNNSNVSMKMSIADNVKDPLTSMLHIQRANILVDELILKIADLGKTTSSEITKTFYLSVIDWIKKYPIDASRYFFEWKMVDNKVRVVKGETAIHQEIFYSWMKKLYFQIPTIKKISNSKIKSFKDIKWLYEKPKTFTTFIEKDLIIKYPKKNLTTRFVWIISVLKEGKNFSKYIEHCQWKSFNISKKSKLEEGDKVAVRAYVMPDHHSHAPIKRIARLRTNKLIFIIKKIKEEEITGKINYNFWKERKMRVEKAKLALQGEVFI